MDTEEASVSEVSVGAGKPPGISIPGGKGEGLNWVYAAASNDVEYTLTVTDTATGRIARYDNPLGRRAPAVTDTQAFATCP